MAWTQADSFNITLGSVDTGLITDTYTDNAVRHVLNEVSGAFPAGGFDYEYWYETIPGTVSWIRVVFNGFYDGNPSHLVTAYVWNYSLAQWDSIFNLPDASTDYDRTSADLPASNYVSGGQAKVRILHLSKGLSGHKLRVDRLVLEDRTAFNPPTTAPPTTLPPTTVVPTTTLTTAAPTTLGPTTLAPTTLAPTTLAPTTTLTTAPPTTTLTTSPPTTVGPTTVPPTTPVSETIIIDPIDIVISFNFAYHYQPPIPGGEDITGDAGPVELGSITIHGYMLNVGISVDPIEIVVTIPSTNFNFGEVIDAGPINLTLSLPSVDILIDQEDCNWIQWSKIGELNFDIDESNIAGKRPLDWAGCVYHTGRLRDKVGVYGANGVSLLKPSGVHFGMDTIYRIGLKNKGAFAGNEEVHFFVDLLGQLWQLDDKLTKLDYSEFIGAMGTVILSMDIEKKLLYICDGTYGYIYSIETKSLGKGPATVTGLGAKNNLLYVGSSAEIATPKFEICTDIYDLGTRKYKTIHEVEFGTDPSQFMFASLDYRVGHKEPFKQIGWFMVNPDGKAYPKCYGVEFRFRLKSMIYEYFELDYVRVKGHVHGYSYLDSLI